MLAADFLEANFDKVFGHYQKLLHSDNYVTRRQSLKLLGELLLDRHNFSVSSFFFSCIYMRANFLLAAGDDSLYFQSRELETYDEHVERKVSQHSI